MTPRDKARSRWKNIISRCHNPKAKDFKYYGGRGITVCERWRAFSNFYDDVGNPPKPRLQIDRIDNLKGYQPDNWRWATKKEQEANKQGRQSRQKSALARVYDGTRELGLNEAAALAGCTSRALARRMTDIRKKRGVIDFQLKDLIATAAAFKNAHDSKSMEAALALMNKVW